MKRFNNQGNALMLGLGIMSLVLILAAVGGYFYLKSTSKTTELAVSPITTPTGSNKSLPVNKTGSQSTTSGSSNTITSASDLDKLSSELDSANLDVSSDITQ